MDYAIDLFAVFAGHISLSGWLLDSKSVLELALVGPGIPGGKHVIGSYGRLLSADVEAIHGAAGEGARFAEIIEIDPSTFSVRAARLMARRSNGEVFLIHDLGASINQPAAELSGRFWNAVRNRPAGQLLEVGSRARSGVVRRDEVPPGWGYVGLDVMAGPNVDVVGDAHELSAIFPVQRFDAVYAASVLEHLLMPWKFAAELNRVLNVGAVGLFTTHQCWPMHDEPWDFWRFSDQAWNGLLNKATGFEIIDAQMGEPAFIVAQRCHAVTDFAPVPAGFLASNVLFRKVAETALDWPVRVADIIATVYPSGEIASPV